MRPFEVRAARPAIYGVACQLPVLVATALAAGLLTGPAAAQDRISVDVIVSHISSRSGTIDPRGRIVHEKLRSQIRYESLRVLQQEHLDLRIDQIGSLELPNQRKLRVRPMDVGERGVLLAVEVEGFADSDLRIPNHHMVIFGTHPFEDGKLVISIEPAW